MSLFGTARDASLVRHIGRELVNNIIEQQVGYYKIDLSKTTVNMYGESNGAKAYYDPVLINCIIERTPPTWKTDSFGPDVDQDLTVRFLRDDLLNAELSTESTELSGGGRGFTYGIVPEVGDIILWDEAYYEVDGIIENQYFVGKNPSYSYSDDNTNFGSSISIIVNAHLTRNETLGISQDRL
jgi:hypothetical protein